MGRSRGGFTSKIHALVDAEGRPVNVGLTGSQVDRLHRGRRALTDEPDEGNILLADKGYDTNAIRAKPAKRNAWANIPPKRNRKGCLVFGLDLLQRNLVEHFFNRIKQFRGNRNPIRQRPETGRRKIGRR